LATRATGINQAVTILSGSSHGLETLLKDIMKSRYKGSVLQ